MNFNSTLTLAGLLSLFMCIAACSDDDDSGVDTIEEPTNKRTGFVSFGFTSNSRIMKYFEELPSGVVDVSDGTDFERLLLSSIVNGAILTRRPDGSPGFSKIVVNAEGEFVEEAFIPLSSGRTVISARDSLTGVFQDAATPDIIRVFNPTTFEVTGAIDMSAGALPDGITRQYESFTFRGDDVFSPFADADGAGLTEFIVHQANLSSTSFVGDTQREGNGSGSILTSNAGGIDLAGNLYIPDGGGIEPGLAARLNKVPAGSNEIDPTYIFEPAATLNPTNFFLPYFEGFKILESGQAIALVNSEVPQQALDIIEDAGGIGNITAVELLQIQGIILGAETARWCELDLEERTVTPISGIPNITPLGGGSVFEHDGDVYISVNTEAEDACYRWNPMSGTVSTAFVMTGLENPVFYNLADDF
ncbi:MAG: hypothetical protein AAF519_00875 [Bacteroidota bacterium]